MLGSGSSEVLAYYLRAADAERGADPDRMTPYGRSNCTTNTGGSGSTPSAEILSLGAWSPFMLLADDLVIRKVEE